MSKLLVGVLVGALGGLAMVLRRLEEIGAGREAAPATAAS